MSNQPELTGTCPTGEELSAWYDSELRDAGIEAHVKGCARCQGVVNTYRQIDQRIQGNLAVLATDSVVVRRIKRQSLDRIQAQQDHALFRSSWGRIAALAAAACVAMALLVYVRDFTASRGRDVQQTTPVFQPAAAVWTPAEVRVLACAANDENLPPVAADTAPEAVTATVLHHVWAAPAPAAAVTALAGLVAPDATPALAALAQRPAERYTIELLLPGTQLQGLINRLDAKGLKLLSATGPQPGAPGAAVPAPKPVRYRVAFVRR